MLYTIALWWSWTISDVAGSHSAAVRVSPPRIQWSAAATARLHRRGAAEQRRGPSRADGSLECARVTDKALGEPELSRPMARAAPTPSKGMCALHVCRCPVA